MKVKLLAALALVAALTGAVAFGTAERAEAQPVTANVGLRIPLEVEGVTNAVLTIERFVTQGNQLVAVGTFTGVVDGREITRQVRIPVLTGGSQGGSCEILHLELGPLDLNLLGLMVHLDKIVLDITAQPGPGNLLGNLLCAVTGLLDQNGPLDLVTGILNYLLQRGALVLGTTGA